jgi:PAS domain S-box-containing protein
MLRAITWPLGVVIGSIGGLVLCGWALDFSPLKSVFPGLAAMKANTALAFLCSGLALHLFQQQQATPSQRRIGLACGTAVILISGLTLGEYLGGWDFGIDQLLFIDRSGTTEPSLPGRMAPSTASNFLFLGVALVLLETRLHFWLTQSLTLIALGISYLALAGYLYGVPTAYRIGISLHAAITFLLLGVGILAVRPDQGVLAIVTSESAGGLIARRLLPMAMVVPMLIGWLRLKGEQAGLYGTEFGLALFAVSNVLCFSTLILWTAASLNRTDSGRQRAEERFRQAVEAAPNGMVMIDSRGQIVLVNAQTERLFGYHRDELLGQPVELLVPDRFRDQHPENRANFMASPQVRSMGVGRDLYGRRKDGSEFPVEIGLNPIKTDEGLLVLSAVVDITERKRAEERFHQAVESAPNGMVMINSNGQIVLVNAQTERLFGYRRDELLGQPVELLVPDRFREQHPENRARFMASPQVRSMGVGRDLYGRRKDGSEFPVEIGLNPIQSDEGLLVLSAVVDITERKQAEQAAANYSERLRILHEIDKALIAGKGLEAIAAEALPPLRELLGVARAIVNLFDRELKEVEWLAAAGRQRVHVGPGVRYSIRLMGDVEALRRGELQMIDVHTLPPSPEVDALLDSGVHTYAVVPMITKGELIGAISFGGVSEPFSSEQISIVQEVATLFAIAITQARLYEEIQRQTRELEGRVRERTQELESALVDLQAANKELDAFSYSVSHDLRAPLRAIDGFSRILQMEHAAILPAEVREFLHDIRTNTQKMGHLVDDLLSFSRLSRQPLKRQFVDTSVLVRQCLEELSGERNGREVQVQLGELAHCWADPALLKQVWMNLISNAFKYTSKREAAEIEIGSRASDVPGQRSYFVRDNGVGFDMRYAQKLFGVFQRLHREEDYEGTGVGLAIVQRILHRHGGRVWAEGQPDHGATFSFSLSESEES